ncbi:MAG: cysteine hydrolase [Candidatus Hatepunaea meridiana]|nr:cysteine hydrolase [Candidatus Hatepunaea meridiana]
MKPYVTAESIRTKTDAWLEKISPYNQHYLKLHSEKAALLVIDMQYFFLDPSSPTYIDSGYIILSNIQKLINAFRTLNRPVIYTRHVHHPQKLDAGIMEWWWEGMCLEGSPESVIHRDIVPLAEEKVILKHRYSAFYNTDLETILRCLKIEDVVISGVMTNMCCESTARDAYYRDYRTFFLADATGSISEEMHLASLLNLAFGFAYITTTEDIIQQM